MDDEVDLLRVIAGEYRGRILKSVPGKNTRPTSNKVKEAIFQRMGPFFKNGQCLDLFAGSGALGIEALSRGIDHVTFVDRDRRAIQVIKENLQLLQLTDENAFVHRSEAMGALQFFSNNNKVFDLILIDPPYEVIDFEQYLSFITQGNLISNKGIIYCEHTKNEHLPETIFNLRKSYTVSYGQTTNVSFYNVIQ